MSIFVRSMSLLCAVSVASFAHASDHIFADSFEFGTKISQADVEQAFTDDSVWATLKSRCDDDLNDVITDIYAGFDWRRRRARLRALLQRRHRCAAIRRRRRIRRKPIAILKVLARSFPVIAPNQNHQFLASATAHQGVHLADDAARGHQRERLFQRDRGHVLHLQPPPGSPTSRRNSSSGALYPILRISNSMAGATSNAAPEYTRKSTGTFRSATSSTSTASSTCCIGSAAHHPAGKFYLSTIANEDDTPYRPAISPSAAPRSRSRPRRRRTRRCSCNTSAATTRRPAISMAPSSR